ncbi:hypothetical protein RCG24_11460 [Neobacillus sp. OS1-32]|jgi:uncharacterized membrane protein|uniref:DUF4083 domain-containing protein n=1 Tax=Neobacillus paridis TaxID=2803862 RepID=A0ABS1TSL1_9BACI|nr:MULTISPECIES: hypothetical protein [Neobacillus]MBL4953714.1 hypothetical protein [Neobacillus paridis]WML28664.1 hypothetical protein RCG24_11460 [Neobacillus sp. OS1-32]
MNNFIPGLIALLPLILFAFVLRWIRLIKINSEIQVDQNKKIISLLEELKNNKGSAG